MIVCRVMSGVSYFSPCHVPRHRLRVIPATIVTRGSHSRDEFSHALTHGGATSHVLKFTSTCHLSALKSTSAGQLGTTLRTNSRRSWGDIATWTMFPLLAAASSAQSDASSAQSDADPQGTVIFTSFGCPYCKRAKATLGDQGVAFREVGVDPRPELREALARVTGRKSVPVVYVNGRYVGGSDELEEAVEQKRLAALLESPPQEIPTELKHLADAPAAGARAGGDGGGAVGTKSQIRRLKLEQIADRMGDARGGVRRSDVKVGGWGGGNQKAFSGKEGVGWMMKNMPDVLDADEAVRISIELQHAHLLHHVSFSEPFSGVSEEYFQLLSDSPPLSSALNAQTTYLKPARPASEVAEDLRTKVLELYDFALSKDGRSVNYGRLAGSKEFSAYVAASKELQRVDVFALSRNEQLAFWINIYNALIIHAMVQNGPPKSSLDRLSFYRSNKYHVGGHDWSLDDIEHGVLRGNRKTLLNLLGSRPLGSRDPRRFFAMTPLDPRIHFALNCGAKSCPPIKVFSASNVDVALNGAVSSFCEGEVVVDAATKVVTLSKILDWYKVDFGKDVEERLRWLLPYVDEDNKKKLAKLLEEGGYTVEYSAYDWGLNE